MQITLDVDSVAFQAYQNLDEKEKQSLNNIFDNFLKYSYLLKTNVSNSSNVNTTQGVKRVAGSAKGEIQITPDFDEPLEEFKDYR